MNVISGGGVPREETSEKKKLSKTAKAPVEIIRDVKKQRNTAAISGLSRGYQA